MQKCYIVTEAWLIILWDKNIIQCSKYNMCKASNPLSYQFSNFSLKLKKDN